MMFLVLTFFLKTKKIELEALHTHTQKLNLTSMCAVIKRSCCSSRKYYQLNVTLIVSICCRGLGGVVKFGFSLKEFLLQPINVKGKKLKGNGRNSKEYLHVLLHASLTLKTMFKNTTTYIRAF